MSQQSSIWRSCSSCKTPIQLGQKYYVCSVSTCNSKRTGYVFCSVPCFERHLPGARHKDAAAVEERAPLVADAPASAETEERPRRRIVASQPAAASSQTARLKSEAPQEVLVIASRLKDYIQARSDYNTSQSVMSVLSDHLRKLCDQAIENAQADGRRTVMDRDFRL